MEEDTKTRAAMVRNDFLALQLSVRYTYGRNPLFSLRLRPGLSANITADICAVKLRVKGHLVWFRLALGIVFLLLYTLASLQSPYGLVRTSRFICYTYFLGI
jgi:thiosulfate reductase cytochrome b subunit